MTIYYVLGNSKTERIRGKCISNLDSICSNYEKEDDNSHYKPLVINHFLNNKLIGYERLPMLEVVCDNLVKFLSVSLRNLAQDSVSVEITKILSCRFGECINDLKIPSLFSIFYIEELTNYGLVTVESDIVYSLIEILMGGKQRHTEKLISTMFTNIDKGLVNKFINIFLTELSESFSLIYKAKFNLIHTEVDSRFVHIVRSANASVLIHISIKIGAMEGLVNLILPYATIEPIKDLLSQQFIGEKFGRDKVWETHLGEELRKTDVDLVAGFYEQPISLKFLATLEIAALVHLDSRFNNSIEIRINGILLFKSRLAIKSKNIVAIVQ